MPSTEIELGYDWFTDLDVNERGALGEAFAKIYLKRRLNECYDHVCDDLNVVGVRSPYHDVTFHANPVDEDGTHEHLRWSADLVFHLTTTRSVKQVPKILVEVKTGEYAELERNQRTVMERLSQQSLHVVLRCEVAIREDGFTLSFAEFAPYTDDVWLPVDFLVFD